MDLCKGASESQSAKNRKIVSTTIRNVGTDGTAQLPPRLKSTFFEEKKSLPTPLQNCNPFEFFSKNIDISL